jgi:hypothetical protein
MPGWGVYVEELAYQKFLSNYVDHPEVCSHCNSSFTSQFFYILQVNDCESEHDALAKAATRGIPGYASSGNGIAICSRHGLIRSAGDLQKGEKCVKLKPSHPCCPADLGYSLKILQHGLHHTDSPHWYHSAARTHNV